MKVLIEMLRIGRGKILDLGDLKPSILNKKNSTAGSEERFIGEEGFCHHSSTTLLGRSMFTLQHVLSIVKSTGMKKKTRFLPIGARKFLSSQIFDCLPGVCMGDGSQNSFPKYKKNIEIKISLFRLLDHKCYIVLQLRFCLFFFFLYKMQRNDRCGVHLMSEVYSFG